MLSFIFFKFNFSFKCNTAYRSKNVEDNAQYLQLKCIMYGGEQKALHMMTNPCATALAAWGSTGSCPQKLGSVGPSQN